MKTLLVPAYSRENSCYIRTTIDNDPKQVDLIKEGGDIMGEKKKDVEEKEAPEMEPTSETELKHQVEELQRELRKKDLLINLLSEEMTRE